MRHLLCLTLLMGGCEMMKPSVPDYRGLAAVHLAIATMVLDGPSPPVNKPKRIDCPECRGTGQVRTGDGLSWTECENCLPPETQPVPPPVPDTAPEPPAVDLQPVEPAPLPKATPAPEIKADPVPVPESRPRSGGCQGGSCSPQKSSGSRGFFPFPRLF